MSLTKVTYSMINGAPINPVDFGADPTGVSDSSSAIQAALNTGRVVDLGDSNNTYLVTSPITYTGQITLKGSGATIKTNIQWLKVIDGNDSLLDGFNVEPATIPYTVLRDPSDWSLVPTVTQTLAGYIPSGLDTDIWPINAAYQAVNNTIKPSIYFTVSSSAGGSNVEVSNIGGNQLCLIMEGYTNINIHDNYFNAGQTTYAGILIFNGVPVAYNSAPLGFTLPRGKNNSVINNTIKYATLNGICWFGNDEYECSGNETSFNGESGIKTYQYDGVAGPSATIACVNTTGRIIGNKVSDNFYDGIDAQVQYGIAFTYIFAGTVLQGNVMERNRRTGSNSNGASMVYTGNFANFNGSDGIRVLGSGNTVVGNHARQNCQYPDGAQVFDIIIQGDDAIGFGNNIFNPTAPSTYNYLHSGLLGVDPTSGREGMDFGNYCSEGAARIAVSSTIPSTRTPVFGFDWLKTNELTVATLPTAQTGRRAFVTDSTTATFGAGVTGGGSNAVPVYYNGTSWVVG